MKEKLTIKDIINNTIDELQRAKEIIKDKSNYELSQHDAELFDDIDKSIERLSSIEDTVLVALVAAVYAGNIESDGKGFIDDFGADSLEHRREYLAMAEHYDLPYTEDGKISSEDVYNDISDMVHNKYQTNPPMNVIITASELELDTDDFFEDEDELSDIVSNYLSNTYDFCHYGFDMEKVYNENNEPSQVIVSNIKWDTTD